MDNNKDKFKTDKFVIIILFVFAPLFFISGTFLFVLGILFIVWGWSPSYTSYGFIIFGLLLLVFFIACLYLSIKRLKEIKKETIDEEKTELALVED